MANTHRAVVEGSVPPRMTVVAAGPQDFCEQQLSRWVDAHPLEWDESAVMLHVVSEQPSTVPAPEGV